MKKNFPESLRIGAIGCGQFMSRQHIQTIARSSRLRLQHLADLDADKLKRVGDRYSPQRRTTDWRDVVNDPEVDIVVAGVLPELHPVIARASLEAGKPIYVEKPLAPTLQEGLEVAAVAERMGLPVGVGFNRRFAPATAVLRQALAAKRKPLFASYRIADDDRVRPPDQRWKTVDRLLTETVHIFDLLAYLYKSEPVRITAEEEGPGDVSLMLEFASDDRVMIQLSGRGSLAEPKERLELAMGGAVIFMCDYVEVRGYGALGIPTLSRFAGRAYDDCDNSHVAAFRENGQDALIEMRARYERAFRESGVLADSGSAQAWADCARRLGSPPLPQINYAPDKGWGAALEEFCLAAAAGRKPENADARDGNRATACAVAARESIRTKKMMEIDPRSWRAS